MSKLLSRGFGGTRDDGVAPFAAHASTGNLYGTTQNGVSYGYGPVYTVTVHRLSFRSSHPNTGVNGPISNAVDLSFRGFASQSGVWWNRILRVWRFRWRSVRICFTGRIRTGSVGGSR